MNKQLLRKLLAGLLVCAMLLVSLAAFADDEQPANPTTTTSEDTVDQDESNDSTKNNANATDPVDPADDVDDNDDNTVVDDDDEDIVNDDEDIVNGDEDDVNDDADVEDNESEDVVVGDADVEDNENEDVVDDEGNPIVPPIIFGGVPEVDDAEGEGDDAEGEGDDGISLMYIKPHEHKWNYDWEQTIKISEEKWDAKYEIIDATKHKCSEIRFMVWYCEDCGDTLTETFENTYTARHYRDHRCDAEGNDDKDGNYYRCRCGFIIDANFSNAGIRDHNHEDGMMPRNDHGVYTDLNRNMFKDVTCTISESTYDSLGSVGHAKYTTYTLSGTCSVPGCGEVYTVTSFNRWDEKHDFDGDKCRLCGYARTKKKEDTRVRMGTKLMREIRALVAEGATVNLYNENLVYTEAELAAVQAVSDPFERMLMMLAALGCGDEVDYAIRTQGLEVSDAALALIDQLGARAALPGAADVFLSTEKVNGTDREVVTISLVVSGNGDVTKSYTFYKDGSSFYFFD